MTSQRHEAAVIEMFRALAKLGPRQGVARLKRLWTPFVEENGLENARMLVECLASRSRSWRAELRKSVRGKRSCFKTHSAELQELLQRASGHAVADALAAPIEIIRAHRHPERTIAVELGTEQTSIHELHGTIEALHAVTANGDMPVSLEVHVHGEVLYVYGLALIAAWAARHCAELEMTCDSSLAGEYLDRIGFTGQVVRAEAADDVVFDSQNSVALTRVDRVEIERADAIAGRVANLFQLHCGLDEANTRALKLVMAELVENVYRHSRSNYPGYVLAQAHPTTRKLQLAIADTGIGVYATFRESDNADAQELARNPRDAVRVASDPLVTSKKERHAGYGLYVIRSLAQQNRGTFRLTSGRYSDVRRPKRRGQPRPVTEHAAWRGTFVGVLLDMDRQLDLEKVYQTLPVPKGYEEEDFLA